MRWPRDVAACETHPKVQPLAADAATLELPGARPNVDAT